MIYDREDYKNISYIINVIYIYKFFYLFINERYEFLIYKRSEIYIFSLESDLSIN